MKKRWKGGLLFTGALVVLPILLPLILPGSGINRHEGHINLQTGHAKFVRRIWFLPFQSQIQETALSKALRGERVIAGDLQPWQIVWLDCPAGSISPHFRFHGALHQATQFGMIFPRLPDEDRMTIASEILRIWQTSGGYFDAVAYVEAQMDLHLYSQ